MKVIPQGTLHKTYAYESRADVIAQFHLAVISERSRRWKAHAAFNLPPSQIVGTLAEPTRLVIFVND